MSRKNNQSITDWEAEHEKYVQEWNEWKGCKDTERRVIDWDDYEDHMLWYDDGIKHHLRLRPQWTTADVEDLFDDASENEAYNESIRQVQGGFMEYGPLMNRVVCCFYLFRTGRWMKTAFRAIDSFYYFAVFGAEQKHFSCL